MRDRILRTAITLVPFVGLVGTIVMTVIDVLAPGGDLGRDLLENSVLWMIGVQGWMTGCGHMFFGEPIAESIGWPSKTPWQWEVGLASLATGVLGVIASGFGDEFTLATIIAFSVFYLGAAVGHVREMVTHRNFKAGNAGPIFFFDVLVPVYLIVLYTVVT
ncbi:MULTISPECIES: DUF6790 family protein [Gordonia]|uniref:DUF6790 family protein n=1 Tax=Gordonia amicalis TaxID=89053 RepID=A0ABU4DFM5_9ACTN|nr:MULTISPECIES: DUF6790 family protein [Gordonia]ATD71787.1 hypothetical protein CNO18_17505 [Gordonia sp. 1D]MCR8897224.1 hypothetical protein [Gordonia sp. GONU]MCZ4652933.1 hypothetical protein [Gordonia amicalis]MDJ0453686.1 hypothetical protein [Gordonia amicalis]MDV6308542.1 DUF6790 family protein [Gordonia amicalis]